MMVGTLTHKIYGNSLTRYFSKTINTGYIEQHKSSSITTMCLPDVRLSLQLSEQKLSQQLPD